MKKQDIIKKKRKELEDILDRLQNPLPISLWFVCEDNVYRDDRGNNVTKEFIDGFINDPKYKVVIFDVITEERARKIQEEMNRKSESAKGKSLYDLNNSKSENK